MAVTWAAQQYGFPNGLVKNSATLSHALPHSQERTTQVVAGMKIELTLAPPGEHVYTAQLDNGAALIAAVDQNGIDLVIDVYDPDGQRLSRLDSPNGTQGPEPINFTALRSGVYKFVVHAREKDAKPGKYVMKVDQILGPVDDARRLAKDRYPTKALYDLWETSLTDPTAVERFIASYKQSGPIIEPIPGNPLEMRVTYFSLGDQNTERAVLLGGPDYMGYEMTRLGRTNLFFARHVVPTDARFEYAVILIKMHRAGPSGEVEVTEEVHSGNSILEMPNAPAQPYVTAKESVPKGKTVQTTITSSLLKEERRITVYTPAGYDGKQGHNLLIVFDGVIYGGLPGQAQAAVPTPTILDNLIAEKKIGPTVAILVWHMGKRNRDLTGSKPFADFVASEIVPWARSHYNILPGPKSVVTAGSSLGGYAATFSAFTHPKVIGNVLSQSGSYWLSKNWQTVDAGFERRLYPRETGTMIEAFKTSKRLPIRFYMEVGIYDMGAAMLGSNRELRDVLQLKGYDVVYQEFIGGHDFVNWRGSLADGLISLLGRRRN
jgi:enterochelin esterase family protein